MDEGKSQEEIAAEIGISDRQLRRYFKDGCPKGPVSAIIEWRDSNIDTRVEDIPAGELKEAVIRAQLETEIQRGKKLEIENRKLEGELIEIERVQKDIAAVCVRMRSRLMGLGAEIAAMVPGEIKGVTKQKVENAVRLALKEIAEAGVGE